MKKIIITMFLTIFLCASTNAARIKTKSSIRIKRSSRDNLFTSSTKISTTGLTYSTSDKSKKKNKKALLNRFVADNLNDLSIDIAKGSGEYVEALAEILDVSGVNKESFFQNLKTNFDIIFPIEETDHKYVVAEIESIEGHTLKVK
ncbi:MAG: DUF3015 domain-containing protein [Deltaproteobacteria bacterium]|nr:DUF3015 domain-containing protein [Deltaproteobacteria bacterium]